MPLNPAVKIVDGGTSVANGTAHKVSSANVTFQLVANTSSGSGTVDTSIKASMDGTTFTELGTLTIAALTTSAQSAATAIVDPWMFIRGDITTIGGTGATATIWMCTEAK